MTSREGAQADTQAEGKGETHTGKRQTGDGKEGQGREESGRERKTAQWELARESDLREGERKQNIRANRKEEGRVVVSWAQFCLTMEQYSPSLGLSLLSSKMGPSFLLCWWEEGLGTLSQDDGSDIDSGRCGAWPSGFILTPPGTDGNPRTFQTWERPPPSLPLQGPILPRPRCGVCPSPPCTRGALLTGQEGRPRASLSSSEDAAEAG